VPDVLSQPEPALYALRQEATIIEEPTAVQPKPVFHAAVDESAFFAEIEAGLRADRALITAGLAALFSAHDGGSRPGPVMATAVVTPAAAPGTQAALPAALPVAEAPRITSWYSDDHYVIPFSNGSQRLTDAGRGEAAAIAALAQHAETVELRGRVGNRVLRDRDGRLALGRALAVRNELVAAGVPIARIKIRMPREADLLDRESFDSPLNMSVSVHLRSTTTAVAASKTPPQSAGRS
jgi:outer membrane protein OmpA-like peptidoglycan-associated protein